MSKRTKSIKIRLTEKEHQDLLSRSGNIPLAEWLRNIGLGQKIADLPKRRKIYPKVDPALTSQLARLGNNINQITRVVNRTKHSIDKIWLLTALTGFRESLEQIREDHKNDNNLS